MPKAGIGDAEIYYEEHGKGEPLIDISRGRPGRPR